jgi:O-antigen/teichoic acid export membrane protein
VPVSLTVVAERWLLDKDLTRAFALNFVTGLAANVAANLILLPRLGLVAAAWSTVLAYTVVALVTPLLDPRQRRLLAAALRAFRTQHPEPGT